MRICMSFSSLVMNTLNKCFATISTLIHYHLQWSYSSLLNLVLINVIKSEPIPTYSQGDIFDSLPFFRPFNTLRSDRPRQDPDLHRNITQIISSRGFIPEVHRFVTEDDYIITLVRIKNPFNKNPAPQPLLLQHGYLCSGTFWILNSPGGDAIPPRNLTSDKDVIVGNNLGFEMSNFGFDVWLGNFRGTRYSMGHVRLKPLDLGYWNFNIDNFMLDIKGSIQYILSTTRRSFISYVGHSLGTTTLFVLFSENPEYQELVKPAFSLSPLTRLKGAKTPLTLLQNVPFFPEIAREVGGPLNYPLSIQSTLSNLLCNYYNSPLCQLPGFTLGGFSWDQFNYTRYPVYANQVLDSTSLWMFVHLAQIYISDRFQKFDFGPLRNYRHYRQATPPEYPLENIDHKYLAFFYSDGDWVVVPADVHRLAGVFKAPLYEDFEVPLPHWNHFDFALAHDTGKYINSRIVNVMHRFFGPYA